MFPGKLSAGLIIGIALIVSAAPSPPRPVNNAVQATLIAEESVRCEDVEKFTTEWFLKNTRPEYTSNLVNNALFYSHGMSTVARTVAKSAQNKMTTIWDVWPCPLYNHDSSPSNAMRCIHADASKRQTFFENMSRAFALKARNFSTVLHSFENYGRPPTTGIWAKVEFPVLSEMGYVDLLEKVNENQSMSEIFWRSKAWLQRLRPWKRSFMDIPGWRGKADGRQGRSSSDGPYEYCLSDRELSFFDRVAW